MHMSIWRGESNYISAYLVKNAFRLTELSQCYLIIPSTECNPQTDPTLLALLTSLFETPLRFVLGSDLNAGHVNWDNFSCIRPSASFNTQLVTLAQDFLTRHLSDVLPPLLNAISMQDDLTTHLTSVTVQLFNSKTIGHGVLVNLTQLSTSIAK